MTSVALLQIVLACWATMPVVDDLDAAVTTARRRECRLMVMVGLPQREARRLGSWIGWSVGPSVRRRLAGDWVVASISDRSAIGRLSDRARREGWLSGWSTWDVRMLEAPSLALVDFTDVTSPRYGEVDFVAPLDRPEVVSPKSLETMLTLPAGAWTQRLLMYAVRVHGEGPRSADSALSPLLVESVARHAAHQAAIRLQGHHGWERRFQELLRELPGDLIPYEVCAESWPGENAYEAALECVRSWRQSPGHWRLVAMPNRFFAYDMARGANGIWYGTGIFAIPRASAP